MKTFRWWSATFLVLCFAAACGGGTSDRDLAEDACALEVMCYPDDWDSAQECIDEELGTLEFAGTVSGSCRQAYRNLLSCIANLSTCEQLDDYYDEPTPDYPCNQEDAALDAACDL